MGYDPFVECAAGGGEAEEVGVVVQDDQPGLGGGGNHEVGNRDPVLAPSCEFVLQLDGSFHHRWGDRGCVEAAALVEDLSVVAKVPGAVEDLEINDGACGEHAVLEQRS